MFDRFVVVDWSANSAPKRGADSIWIADRTADDVELHNPSTRHEAAAVLADIIDDATGQRILIGVDFSFGYPSGTAAALGLAGTPWRTMWELLAEQIDDDDRNRNNRFAVAAGLNDRISAGAAPYWGCPAAFAGTTLARTKPSAAVLGQWRTVESRLRTAGHRPFSSWQLLGAGSVGSQTLTGVPVLTALVDRFAGRVDVWPFTTGPVAPYLATGAVVLAEVWPSLVVTRPRPHLRTGPHVTTTDSGDVWDAVQVDRTTAWLAELDQTGALEAAFEPRVSVDDVDRVVAEEGWVLGVS